MCDVFEEVYQAITTTDFRAELRATMSALANVFAYFTIPLWIIPYIIIRRIRNRR